MCAQVLLLNTSDISRLVTEQQSHQQQEKEFNSSLTASSSSTSSVSTTDAPHFHPVHDGLVGIKEYLFKTAMKINIYFFTKKL